MLVGIGIDFIKVSRIKKLYLKYKTKALLKILSSEERNKFATIKLKSKQIQYLAKRFVAKEALVKALGTGLSAETALKDISIMNNKLGQPYYLLDKKLEKYVKSILKFDNYSLHLSLSDDKEHALAVAIIENHDPI